MGSEEVEAEANRELDHVDVNFLPVAVALSTHSKYL